MVGPGWCRCSLADRCHLSVEFHIQTGKEGEAGWRSGDVSKVNTVQLPYSPSPDCCPANISFNVETLAGPGRSLDPFSISSSSSSLSLSLSSDRIHPEVSESPPSSLFSSVESSPEPPDPPEAPAESLGAVVSFSPDGGASPWDPSSSDEDDEDPDLSEPELVSPAAAPFTMAGETVVGSAGDVLTLMIGLARMSSAVITSSVLRMLQHLCQMT